MREIFLRPAERQTRLSHLPAKSADLRFHTRMLGGLSQHGQNQVGNVAHVTPPVFVAAIAASCLLMGCSAGPLTASEALMAFDEDAEQTFHGKILKHFDADAPNHYCQKRVDRFECETFLVVAGEPTLVAGTVIEHSDAFEIRAHIVRH